MFIKIINIANAVNVIKRPQQKRNNILHHTLSLSLVPTV
jgi:hypothetical protein